jgi:hypothetical protein
MMAVTTKRAINVNLSSNREMLPCGFLPGTLIEEEMQTIGLASR